MLVIISKAIVVNFCFMFFFFKGGGGYAQSFCKFAFDAVLF